MIGPLPWTRRATSTDFAVLTCSRSGTPSDRRWWRNREALRSRRSTSTTA
ncbi:hypothetical protein [Lentzea sp. NPDC060358]